VTSSRLAGLSGAHLFGTDSNGMDVFSRVVYAARKDLLLPLAAAALSVVVGVPLGALAGFVGGWLDRILSRAAEILQAFPVVLLALTILVAVGSSLVNVAAVIALINVPIYFRIVRSLVQPMRSAEFVEAARLTGNTGAGIVLRHLLPNVWSPVLAQFTVNFAWAIQILAGLSFLGLGIRVPNAEWGLMVQQGSEYVAEGKWWIAFFPGIAIFATVLTLNRIGAWIQSVSRAR
jgi:peptide/nickel transport system permease protein